MSGRGRMPQVAEFVNRQDLVLYHRMRSLNLTLHLFGSEGLEIFVLERIIDNGKGLKSLPVNQSWG